MTPAKLQMVRARVALLNTQPFFGDLALGMTLVERDTLKPPTLATDGKSLFYHPEWVLKNDPDVVQAGIAHEVMHKALNHMTRRNHRTPVRWNFAVDYAANAILRDAGFTIPKDWLCDRKYDDLPAERIYEMLPDMPEDKNFDQHSDVQMTEEEIEDVMREVMQAANAVSDKSKLPSMVKRFIDHITEVKADWRSVMSRFATEASKNDFSWQRVNSKMAAYGIYLPALYSQSLGTVAAGIDTSGSISQEVLQAFAGHLSEIKGQMQPLSTHIIYCDAEVNHADHFDQYEDLRLEPHGGGGTDFRPVFAHIEEHNIRPACFMYLTDGYGTFPSTPPGYPVLWLMTTDVQPPWGEVVRISAP